ncbi:MAG TPA: hypothetical protein VGF17_09875 [Phytomonospora sp.]
MGVVADRLERLTITTGSPDGSVHVRLDRAAGITVTLRAGAHRERTLAAQAEAALTAAFTAYDKAVGLIRESVTGTPAPAAGTPFADRHRDYHAGVEAIHATGESPHGYVAVEWHGRKDFRVTIEPRALDELGEAALTAEVNAAVRAAARERSRRVMGVYRGVYQVGMYGERKQT